LLEFKSKDENEAGEWLKRTKKRTFKIMGRSTAIPSASSVCGQLKDISITAIIVIPKHIFNLFINLLQFIINFLHPIVS